MQAGKTVLSVQFSLEVLSLSLFVLPFSDAALRVWRVLPDRRASSSRNSASFSVWPQVLQESLFVPLAFPVLLGLLAFSVQHFELFLIQLVGWLVAEAFSILFLLQA